MYSTSLSTHLSMNIQVVSMSLIVDSATMNLEVHVSFLNQRFVCIYGQEWDCWIIWQFYVQLFEEPLYCVPQWLHQLTFLPMVQEGSLFLHSLQHVLFADILVIALLIRVRCYFIVILICISLLISHAKRLFMCLFSICISSLENSLKIIF